MRADSIESLIVDLDDAAYCKSVSGARHRMVRILRYIVFFGNAPIPRVPLKGQRHEEPSKSALCRGPESDRRHMVLQVMSPAIREIAPELKRDETWLWSMTNCSTKDGEHAFRTLL